MQRTFLEAHRLTGYFWSLGFGEVGKEGDFYFQRSTPPYVQKPFFVQWTYITYIIQQQQQQQHRMAAPSKGYIYSELWEPQNKSPDPNSRMFQIPLVGINFSIFWTLIDFFPSLLFHSVPPCLPSFLLQMFIEILLCVIQMIQYCIIIKFSCILQKGKKLK